MGGRKCHTTSGFANFRFRWIIITTIIASTFLLGVVQGQLGLGKSVIEYVGSTFLLTDGCPSPNCDTTQPDCQRTIQTLRNLYSHCLQSEDGQYLGCITDKMLDGSYITLPVYATMCSAMCYESEVGSSDKVTRCPHIGIRQHDATLSNLF